MRILLVGGGSGGHLYPLIAIAKKIKFKFPKEGRPLPNLYFLGPKRQEIEKMKKGGVKSYFLISGKFRRYFSFLTFVDFLKLPLSFIQSAWLVWFIMPDVIFSKGGYAGFFAVFWGWLFRIPVMIHESDSISGLASRFSAPFAKRIGISFEKARDYFPDRKTTLVGHPIREEILKGSPENAQAIFNLSEERPVILVMGGSQGARKINNLILFILLDLLKEVEIIHQVGDRHFKSIKTYIQHNLPSQDRRYYHLVGSLDANQIKHAYAASSLIVSRSGAGAIFEIAAVGKPAILIALASSANNHQSKNAFEYARFGGAIVLKEGNLTPHLLAERMLTLTKNKKTRDEMSQAAKKFAKIDAAEKIARELMELAGTTD